MTGISSSRLADRGLGPHVSLLGAVLDTAAHAPGRIAVESAQSTITYGALASTSLRLADQLRQRGIADGSTLACVLPPGPEALLAALAAHACGASYAPLDPALPEARLRDLLRRLDSPVTFGSTGAVPSILAGGWCDRLEEDVTVILPDPEQVAYVVHTSGSTGYPKAVRVEHRNVLTTISAIDELMPIDRPFRGSWWCGPAFDVAIWESWSPLLAGGTCVVVPKDARWDGEGFARYLAAARLDSAYVPAAFLPDLLRTATTGAEAPLSLKRMLIGVEPIRNDLVQALLAALPGLQVVNGYGPAEAAVCCLLHKVVPGDSREDRLPIGRPLRGNRLLLLDEEGQVSSEDYGELVVVGASVARGYQDDADVGGFIPAPDGSAERAYRTGDMVRRLPDGEYRFEGRRDRQLKLRGHRIEPAEVELALGRQAGVAAAAVVPHEVQGSGAVLVGYVVPLPEHRPDLTAIRAAVAHLLPAAWVPARLVMLDQLPLTPHGKTDFEALCQRSLDDLAVLPGALPSGEVANQVEELLLEVCRRVAPDADLDLGFVAGGGTSLGAQAVTRALRERLVDDVSVGEILGAPTLRVLAANLGARSGPRSAAWFSGKHGRRKGPLSPAQLSIWLHDQMVPDVDTYAEQIAFELSINVNVTRLTKALKQTLLRHPIFSATIEQPPGEVAWRLGAARVSVEVTSVQRDALAWMTQQVWLRPCRLDGPLMQVHIVREPGRAFLLLQWHHVVTDAQSTQLLLDDVATAYDGSENPPATSSAMTLCDFAEELSVTAASPAARRATLEVADRLAPYIGGGSARQSGVDGLRPGCEFSITVPVATDEASAKSDSTLTARVLCAFGQALHEYEPCARLVGLAVSSRSMPGSDQISGCLVDTVVVPLGGERGPDDLESVDKKVAAAVRRPELSPFPHLVAELRRRGELPASFPEVYLTVYEAARLSLDGVRCTQVPLLAQRPKNPLTLDVASGEDGIRLTLRAAAGVLSESACQLMVSTCAEHLVVLW